MTDTKKYFYQPWLRDTTPKRGRGAPLRDEGLAKPKEEPPIGIDLTRYSKPEKPRGEPLVKPEAIKAGAANLWNRVRGGAEAFADWTIRAGERADIPARVEAMEIPRRPREDRKSVVSGKSVSVRVDHGGRRIIKKNTKIKT